MLNSLSIENSLIFSIGLIIVIGSIFSTIILKPILYYDEFRASFTTSISFLLVCTTTLISQFILISYITKKLFSMREYKSSIFMYSNFILLFSTVFLTIVLAFVIKDIFINKIYDLFLFQFVILYSIVVAICIQIIVIIKFLQWIIKKRNIILVLYTITHFFLFAIFYLYFFLI